MIKLPDVNLFLQDFLDVAYIYQRELKPRYFAIPAKRSSIRCKCFTRYIGEYDEAVSHLLSRMGELWAISQKEMSPHVLHLLYQAMQQLDIFDKPFPLVAPAAPLYPNRVDMSTWNAPPVERLENGRKILIQLMCLDKYGQLTYDIEVMRRNYFCIARQNGV